MARAPLLVLFAALAAGCDAGNPVITDPDAPISVDGAPPPPAHLVVYISGYGPDIAWYDFDSATGELAMVGKTAAFAASPSFLAATQTHLYAVSEGASRVGAYAIDQASGALTFINDVASGGNGPAHVSVDKTGAYVLVANYGNGAIAVYPVRGDGGLPAASQTLNAGANAHQILTDPSNAFVVVPCKGSDYVAQYTFSSGTLAANATPRAMTDGGAGPRHLAFGRDAAHAYLVNENDSTLTAFDFGASTGRLSELQTLSTRAASATVSNTGAEVVVHPSGDFVYASNRGDDNIAVFRIAASGMVTLVGHVSTAGKTPRSFAIDPTGHWLLAANQNSSSVTTFSIDPTTGMPSPTGSSLSAASPSFVGFVALPPR